MARRQVTRSGKDRSGNITSLCKPAETWSPRSSASCIADIEGGTHSYYVAWPEKTTEIRVVQGANGKYLRTDRDTTTRNNLDDLPDC
jgi:hypothetical protein